MEQQRKVPENCSDCEHCQWIFTPMYRPICKIGEVSGSYPMCAALKGISKWCPLKAGEQL